MKRLTLIPIFFLFTICTAFAQRTGTVSGIITNDATAEKIAGATIEMKSLTDTTFVRRISSDKEGKFAMPDLPYGDFTMRVSSLGYEPAQRNVTVNARNINLSYIFIKQITLQIGEINVQTQAVRTSMKGDTIVYNAHAFKTSEDADADELLRQLPGVVVNDDGTVKAQGKDVQKIFVDGKETFGTDVATTMKNIPANVIDRVEVYNKLSDFAETTGINDGDDFQVMNFVTGVTFAHFGTFTGLYGWEDKYALEARYNLVSGNHGIMLNATSNNTGASGFGGGFGGISMAGMMGGGGYGSRFSGGSGMSANNKILTHTGGLNYNYQNGEKFRMSFNYRYNHNDSQTKSESEITYFNTDLRQELYNRSNVLSKNNTLSNSHNFGGEMRWKLNAKQNINLRLNGSISDSYANSFSETNQFTDIIENLFQYYKNDNISDAETYSFNAGLNYGLQFNKIGRSLSLGLNTGISKNDNYTTQDIIQRLYTEPQVDSTGRSISVTDNYSWNMRLRAQYSEPFSDYWSLMAVYEYSYNFSDNDRSAQRWEYFEDYNDWRFVDWSQGSNVMEVHSHSHRIGPGIYFSKNNNIFRFDLVYKYTNQKMERTLPEPYLKDAVSFNNFVYNVLYRKNLTPQKRLELSLGADTNNPSINNLQDVDNVSSAISVSRGNPDLKPYYTHSGSIGYNSFKLTNSTNFSVSVNGTVTYNYIGTETMIITDEEWISPNGTLIRQGGRYSRPINMNKSAWSYGVSSSFGKPLNFIKSNFRLLAEFEYNETPGYVNEETNTAKTQSYKFEMALHSNWSSDLIMGLSYQISPGVTNNTNDKYGRSTDFRQTLNYNVTWNTVWDLIFRSDIRYSYRLSKQQGMEDNFLVETVNCNISLGKKIFRNKRGEITFMVKDLFDQSKSASQNVYTDYIVNSIDRGIGRYYSISFTYRLRNFYKNGQNMSRGNRPERDDFMRDNSRGGRRDGGFGGSGRSGGIGGMRNM